jgi:hypothetical protein
MPQRVFPLRASLGIKPGRRCRDAASSFRLDADFFVMPWKAVQSLQDSRDGLSTGFHHLPLRHGPLVCVSAEDT